MALNKKHHPDVARIDLMAGQFGTIISSLNREREAHEHLGVFVYRKGLDYQQGLCQYACVRPSAAGTYAITAWEVPAGMDVLHHLARVSSEPDADELAGARQCLVEMRSHGADELIADLRAYLGATRQDVYAAMFGEAPPEVEVPRQVGHLTVVK